MKTRYKIYLDLDNGTKWYPTEEEWLEVCGIKYEELFSENMPLAPKVKELFVKAQKGYEEYVKKYPLSVEDKETKLELLGYCIYELKYNEEDYNCLSEWESSEIVLSFRKGEYGRL